MSLSAYNMKRGNNIQTPSWIAVELMSAILDVCGSVYTYTQICK